MSNQRAPSRQALGRGIEALLGETTQLHSPGELPINSISPNPDQPRRHFNRDELADLAKSIANHGVLQPLIVRRDGTAYRIIAGERRFRAAQLAGLSTIPAVIRSAEGVQPLEIALVENLQRADLNPIEEARGYRRLMELGNQTQEQVAQRVGKSRVTVTNAIRLLKLPEDMVASVERGEITAGHARALLAVPNTPSRRKLFERIITENLSVRAAEAAVKGPGPHPLEISSPHSRQRPLDPELTALEQQLTEAFGTKVSVRGNPGTGRIVITYFSKDDLERICDRIHLPDRDTNSYQ